MEENSPAQVAFGKPSGGKGGSEVRKRGKWQPTCVWAVEGAVLLEGGLPFGLVRTGKEQVILQNITQFRTFH